LYLEITKTEFDDFGEIQKMIEELAIYENMLDQCHMTVDKLKEDYANGPQVIPEYSKPKFYSSIARIDGNVVGYTVSIGKFQIQGCIPQRKTLWVEFGTINYFENPKSIIFNIFFKDFFTLDHGKETYLEDLYIREDYRRQGIGSVLLSSVWDEAESRDSNGLYWVCLGWNTKSLDFYHSLGAKNQDVTFFRFEIDHEF